MRSHLNPKRLERSLDLLRKINRARYYEGTGVLDDHGKRWKVQYEQELEQHDADARAGMRPEQLSIFERLRPTE